MQAQKQEKPHTNGNHPDPHGRTGGRRCHGQRCCQAIEGGGERGREGIEREMAELRNRTAPMAVRKVERLDEQKERA